MKAIKFEKIRVDDEVVLVSHEDGMVSTHHGRVTVMKLFPPPSEDFRLVADITLNNAYSTTLDGKYDVVILINRPKK